MFWVDVFMSDVFAGFVNKGICYTDMILPFHLINWEKKFYKIYNLDKSVQLLMPKINQTSVILKPRV